MDGTRAYDAYDMAYFECEACGNSVSYPSVTTVLLGSRQCCQVYTLTTPFCQCQGLPGFPMILRTPEPGPPAPDR